MTGLKQLQNKYCQVLIEHVVLLRDSTSECNWQVMLIGEEIIHSEEREQSKVF